MAPAVRDLFSERTLAVRDLFSEHPLAVRCGPEQVAALLWVLRHVPEPVGNFEVEAA
jgi:hypothetical protein